MEQPQQTEKLPIDLRRIWIPLLISVGVSVYLIWGKLDLNTLQDLQFNQQMLVGLLLGIVTVSFRDLAYMYRLKTIFGEGMSWWVSLQVILLWEFGSAVTPGAVGGIALALFILRKEGFSYGQSVATIVLTTIMDNLAFVLVFTILFLINGHAMFDVSALCPDLQGHPVLLGLRSISRGAWIVYGVLIAVTAFLIAGLLISPVAAQKFFYRLGDAKLLRRFKKNFQILGDDIVITAQVFQNSGFLFWLKISFATLVTWISRYLLANSLLYAFNPQPLDHWNIFSRQYVLWTFIMLPSTPGASGLAELSFIALNCEFMPGGLSAAIATVWRLYSYYNYILAGIIVLPKWLNRVNK
ncbi:MAG: lysylphosphatidylglycerol synthase transmembrane domain-containing protein [Chitinophagales bacterium]|nr:flippase-like domain-containing protein [Chitinophagales bacterium]MDW8272812.1 lysylphosphatidylglycerol synthase transmembrane domain-containing protein [Chitinophagales bacterium]